MHLTNNFEITESKLAQLRTLSGPDLKKWIAERNFFAGLSTAYAIEQNKVIYEKIYVRGSNAGAKKTKSTRASKRNPADNSKR